jgi:hypothetical protein
VAQGWHRNSGELDLGAYHGEHNLCCIRTPQNSNQNEAIICVSRLWKREAPYTPRLPALVNMQHHGKTIEYDPDRIVLS